MQTSGRAVAKIFWIDSKVTRMLDLSIISAARKLCARRLDGKACRHALAIVLITEALSLHRTYLRLIPVGKFIPRFTAGREPTRRYQFAKFG